MRKLVALTMVMGLLLGATTVFAAETSTIYRMTKVDGYKDTVGQFVVLDSKDLDNLGFMDYKVIEGDVDYIEVKEGTGIKAYGVNLEKAKVEIKEEVGEGTYLVGYDLAPGKYKLIGNGVSMRLSNVSLNTNNQVIEGVSVEGEGEITVDKDDCALKLVGLRAVKIN